MLHCDLKMLTHFTGDNNFTGNVGFLCDLEQITFNLDDFPNTDCSVSQTATMAQLFAALGVTDFTTFKSTRKAEVCGWKGVGCNSADQVIEISLGEHLHSTLYFFSLQVQLTFTHLHSMLDEVGQGLDGSIPGVVGQLYNLETLDLSEFIFKNSYRFLLFGISLTSSFNFTGNNNLQGTVPKEFLSLSFLKLIDLSE